MKSIVILSGKGGVGKSSITASLALLLSKDHKLICADCDVDASNLSLLFGLKEEDYEEWKHLSTNQKAVIDENACIKCNKCLDTCYFNALEFKDGKPSVSDFGCEGCGACELVCPVKAISLQNINNAKLGYSETKYGFKIVSAQLMPGSSGSGKVVAKVREKARDIALDVDYSLTDSSAGIGCPVIASVTGNDYALIITEPTPSGFSDMKKALEVVDHFRLKKGIIINKYDINKDFTSQIEKFADENSISIISKIPYSKSFPKALVEMIPIVEYDCEFVGIFEDMRERLLNDIDKR